MIEEISAVKIIKHPSLHGLFYPQKERDLYKFIEEKKNTIISVEYNKDARIFMIPHSSYEYIFNHLYNVLNYICSAHFASIIFIAPIHTYDDENIYYPNYNNFNIPGGNIHINYECYKDLKKQFPFCVNSNMPFDEETSFEILLPILSYLKPQISVFPFYIGKNTKIKNIEKFLQWIDMHQQNYATIISNNFKTSIEISSIEFILNEFQSNNKSNTIPIEACNKKLLEIFIQKRNHNFLNTEYTELIENNTKSKMWFVSSAIVG